MTSLFGINCRVLASSMARAMGEQFVQINIAVDSFVLQIAVRDRRWLVSEMALRSSSLTTLLEVCASSAVFMNLVHRLVFSRIAFT